MMAAVHVLIPELAAPQSPQAAALKSEFENPAVLSAYLVNPQKTTLLLGRRYPEMREVLTNNAPFTQSGGVVQGNQSSGLYKKVQSEVAAGGTADNSPMRKFMDKLLTSPGAAADRVPNAYDLLRDQAANNGYNQGTANIAHTISRTMASTRAQDDLRQVATIARQGLWPEMPGLTPFSPPTPRGATQQPHIKPLPPITPLPMDPPPITTPAPDPAVTDQTQQINDTIAKLEISLAKATEATEAMMMRLQESTARNAELMTRLEESERKAQRMELKGDTSDLLREQKQKGASTKEVDEAIAAIAKPEQTELPTAEQVAAKITEFREQVQNKELQAQQELTKKIDDSFSTLRPGANVAQTREWTTKNMDLYNSLDDTGKKAFTSYIQSTYGFWGERETFDPMNFFTRKIAGAAALEISNAKRSREIYIPSTGPTMGRTTTVYEPDPIQIAQVFRSVSDLKDVLPHLQSNPEVRAMRDKLPKEGFIFQGDGIHQKAFDARLAGNKIEAESLLLRSLIENGDMKDPGRRKRAIQEALGTDKQQSDQIRDHYKRTFSTDLLADLRSANSRQIAEQRSADAEVKRQEEALQRAKDKAKAAAARVEDLIE